MPVGRSRIAESHRDAASSSSRRPSSRPRANSGSALSSSADGFGDPWSQGPTGARSFSASVAPRGLRRAARHLRSRRSPRADGARRRRPAVVHARVTCASAFRHARPRLVEPAQLELDLSHGREHPGVPPAEPDRIGELTALPQELQRALGSPSARTAAASDPSACASPFGIPADAAMQREALLGELPDARPVTSSHRRVREPVQERGDAAVVPERAQDGERLRPALLGAFELA